MHRNSQGQDGKFDVKRSFMMPAKIKIMLKFGTALLELCLYKVWGHSNAREAASTVPVRLG
jgi:hypothetical protein